jgi:hypothetical protein
MRWRLETDLGEYVRDGGGGEQIVAGLSRVSHSPL